MDFGTQVVNESIKTMLKESKSDLQVTHSVLIDDDDSSEPSSSVIANVQMSQEVVSDGSDDECPVLINEKALQESIEPELFNCWLPRRVRTSITKRRERFNESSYDDLICQRNEDELGDSFVDSSLWSDHEIDLDRPIYRCKICGRAYAHKRPLLAHEKTHITGRPYQCPICTKCFARQVNFNIHMKLHASGRRYFCSMCGKWFRTQSLMSEHQVTIYHVKVMLEFEKLVQLLYDSKHFSPFSDKIKLNEKNSVASLRLFQQKCFALMNGLPVLTDRPLRYRCYYCDKMFHHRRDKVIFIFRIHHYLSICIKENNLNLESLQNSEVFICGSALRKHEFTKHINENLPHDDYGDSSNEITLVTTPYVN
uniref:Zinc finger protein n=1 Tax=Elaeophora elaphi TaxID=1147741 RepID=A0A0R3S408_9BILA